MRTDAAGGSTTANPVRHVVLELGLSNKIDPGNWHPHVLNDALFLEVHGDRGVTRRAKDEVNDAEIGNVVRTKGTFQSSAVASWLQAVQEED